MAQSQAEPLVTHCSLMHRILEGEQTPCLSLSMLSHRLLLAWGATLSFEGMTPFPGCSEPSLAARPMVLIFFSFKVLLAWLSPLVLRRHRSYALKHRDISWITLLRSALRAIVDGRHSAHTGILAILEEREMPVIGRIFMSLQTLPSTAFIFLVF
jgi:hypothetical protein